MLGGLGFRLSLIRPGLTGDLMATDPAVTTPDEYEYLSDHNGNTLVDHNGNQLITSSAFCGMKDHNGNTLVDHNGNTLSAYQKNLDI
jgi:hypothetical protein